MICSDFFQLTCLIQFPQAPAKSSGSSVPPSSATLYDDDDLNDFNLVCL